MQAENISDCFHLHVFAIRRYSFTILEPRYGHVTGDPAKFTGESRRIPFYHIQGLQRNYKLNRSFYKINNSNILKKKSSLTTKNIVKQLV